MALEILEHIRQAEQRAEQVAQEAQQSAREMVDRAEKACRDREREGEAKPVCVAESLSRSYL